MKVHHCCFGQDYFPAYGIVSPGQVWSNFGSLRKAPIQMKYGMKFQAEMKSKSGYSKGIITGYKSGYNKGMEEFDRSCWAIDLSVI